MMKTAVIGTLALAVAAFAQTGTTTKIPESHDWHSIQKIDDGRHEVDSAQSDWWSYARYRSGHHHGLRLAVLGHQAGDRPRS